MLLPPMWAMQRQMSTKISSRLHLKTRRGDEKHLKYLLRAKSVSLALSKAEQEVGLKRNAELIETKSHVIDLTLIKRNT